jgi:hypothetical protein
MKIEWIKQNKNIKSKSQVGTRCIKTVQDSGGHA